MVEDVLAYVDGLEGLVHPHEHVSQDVPPFLDVDLEGYLVVEQVGLVPAGVGVDSARPSVGPHGAQPDCVSLRKVAHARRPLQDRLLGGSDSQVVLGPLCEDVQHLVELGEVVLVDVPPDTPDGGHRVVDPVAADHLQQVHDDLPVPPDVVEQGVEAYLVGGDPQPEEVAVDPLQLVHEGPEVLRPLGDLHAEDLLHVLGVARLVGVAADPADPLHDVEVLEVGPALHRLLDAPVVVPHPGLDVDDDLPVHLEHEVGGLLQRRVLRPYRYDELSLTHLFPTPFRPLSP